MLVRFALTLLVCCLPSTLLGQDDLVADAVDDAMNNLFGGTAVVNAIYDNDLAALERLLKDGLAPNFPRLDSELQPIFPVLYTAIEAENADAVRLLVRYKADVNGRDKEIGVPLLSHAAAAGSMTMTNLLLELGADPQGKDKHGATALEWAACYGAQAVVDRLRKLGLATEWPMHVAAGTGDLSALKKQIATDRAIDQPVKGWRWTPLAFACNAGHFEAAKLLLEHGANPNLPDALQTFPLHGAVAGSSKPLCELLLAHGADINARAEQAGTALDSAPTAEMAELLTGRGATPGDPAAAGPSIAEWWGRPNANPRAAE